MRLLDSTEKELARKYPGNRALQRFLILAAVGVPHAQEVLNATGEDHLVLIERDDVIWADLQRRIGAGQPTCALYGAAHMYDLEHRLVTQEGYTPAETRWLPVFEADIRNSKITDAGNREDPRGLRCRKVRHLLRRKLFSDAYASPAHQRFLGGTGSCPSVSLWITYCVRRSPKCHRPSCSRGRAGARSSKKQHALPFVDALKERPRSHERGYTRKPCA